MAGGISPIGPSLDLQTTSAGGGKSLVTVRDAAGIPVSAPDPIAAPTPAVDLGRVGGLTSVADASASTLESLSALSESVNLFSVGGLQARPAAQAPAVSGTGATAEPDGNPSPSDPSANLADFGSITINGVTTVLGSVQASYMTGREAAIFVASAINANSSNTVLASVNDEGKLELRSKNGSNIRIEAVGGSTTGDSRHLISIGLSTGTFGNTVTAETAIGGPKFARERRRQADAAAAAAHAAAIAADPARTQAVARAAEEASAATRLTPGRPLEIETAPPKPGISSLPRSVKAGSVELHTADTVRTGLGGVGSPPGSRTMAGEPEPPPLIRDLAMAQGAQAGGQSAAEHIARQTTRAVLDEMGLNLSGSATEAADQSEDPAGQDSSPAPGLAAQPPAPGGRPATIEPPPGSMGFPGLSLTA